MAGMVEETIVNLKHAFESTFSHFITINRSDSLSNWAEAHGLPGIAAGQFGWELVSTAKVRWFAKNQSGSGSSFLIPQGLNKKSISIADGDYKKALQTYPIADPDVIRLTTSR